MRANLVARAWRPVLLVAGLAVAVAIALAIPSDSLAAMPGRDGSLPGLMGFLAAGAALCAVGVPRQLVAYAAGYAFGLWWGTALALVAQAAGCAIDVAWARVAGRGWIARRIGGRYASVDRFLATNTFTAAVMLRLLPLGSNVALNLLAGISSVSAARFLAGSVVGYVPQTLIFATLGTGTQLARSTELGLGVILFGAAAALGALLLRRARAGQPVLSADATNGACGGSLPG